jgi:hypothetical protein
MPRRIFKCLAYQLATEPESAVMIALSGSRGDNSQNTRCGLSGSALAIARFSSVSHHSLTPLSMPRRHGDSFFCVSMGRRARSDVLLSPTGLTSMGYRKLRRLPSMSI